MGSIFFEKKVFFKHSGRSLGPSHYYYYNYYQTEQIYWPFYNTITAGKKSTISAPLF